MSFSVYIGMLNLFYTETLKHVLNKHLGGLNAEVESAFEMKFSTSFFAENECTCSTDS